jgi:hypothetical protein
MQTLIGPAHPVRSIIGTGCTTTFLSIVGDESGCRPFITCS